MAAPWEEELDLQCVATEQLMGRAAAVACAPQGAEKWFFLFLSFLSPGPVSIAIIQSNNPIFLKKKKRHLSDKFLIIYSGVDSGHTRVQMI
jgi:hypothetical protein